MRRVLAAAALLALTAGLTTAVPAVARGPRIVAGRGTRAPAFVTQVDETAPGRTTATAARDYLAARFDRYRIPDPAESLRIIEVIEEGDSTTVRFGQMHDGTPVLGAQYLVHMTGSGSERTVTSVNGHYYTGMTVDTEPRIDPPAAKLLVRARARTVQIEDVLAHGLTVLPEDGGVLTYHFTIRGHKFGTPISMETFVNADTGATVLAFNGLAADGPLIATGKTSHGQSVSLNAYNRGSSFELRDQSRDMFPTFGPTHGQITTHDVEGKSNYVGKASNIETSSSTSFNDGAAVDAHVNAGKVYEFFKALGRDSLDDEGMNIVSSVHYGSSLANAFWDPQTEQIVYGDGEPGGTYPFSAALDIAGHELTHGVVQFTGELFFFNQAGAMNEAYADYFGNAIEVTDESVPMTDPTAGFVGEDLCKSGASFQCPFRDLNDGRTTADYIAFLVDFDGGGVHDNATIYGGALWDIREALGPTADRYIYRALAEFTTPLDTFVDGRNAILAAAQVESAPPGDIDAINAAFDNKGIIDGWDTDSPDDSDVLVAGVLPVGYYFSPPQASGDRFVVGDFADERDFCCEPLELYVGKVDGSGGLDKVGQDGNPKTVNDEMPDLAGKRVVWAHLTQPSSGLDFDVSTRVLGGGVDTVAKGPGFQWFPAVDGKLVAWEDRGSSDTDIYARYVGHKKKLVTDDRGDQLMPQVSGDWIAWWDLGRFGFAPKIGLKNMSTGKTLQIKSHSFIGPPALGDDHVFWYQDPDFNPDVALYKAKLGSTKTIAVVPQRSRFAPVWLGLSENSLISANGSYVSYVDETGYEAFLNGLPTSGSQVGRDLWIVPVSGGRAVHVTSNPGDQAFVSIGDGRRVLWFDGTHGTTDLMTRVVP